MILNQQGKGTESIRIVCQAFFTSAVFPRSGCNPLGLQIWNATCSGMTLWFCPADLLFPNPVGRRWKLKVVLMFLLDWKCAFIELEFPPYLLGMLFVSPLVLLASISVRRCVFAVNNQILVVSSAAFWNCAQLIHITWSIICWSSTPFPLTLCYPCLIFTDKTDPGMNQGTNCSLFSFCAQDSHRQTPPCLRSCSAWVLAESFFRPFTDYFML